MTGPPNEPWDILQSVTLADTRSASFVSGFQFFLIEKYLYPWHHARAMAKARRWAAINRITEGEYDAS